MNAQQLQHTYDQSVRPSFDEVDTRAKNYYARMLLFALSSAVAVATVWAIVRCL